MEKKCQLSAGFELEDRWRFKIFRCVLGEEPLYLKTGKVFLKGLRVALPDGSGFYQKCLIEVEFLLLTT